MKEREGSFRTAFNRRLSDGEVAAKKILLLAVLGSTRFFNVSSNK